jgi:hypothetical protein
MKVSKNSPARRPNFKLSLPEVPKGIDGLDAAQRRNLALPQLHFTPRPQAGSSSGWLPWPERGVYDSRQNNVRNTVYESRLAKLVMENPGLWRGPAGKVNLALAATLEKTQHNPTVQDWVRKHGGAEALFKTLEKGGLPMFDVHKSFFEEIVNTVPSEGNGEAKHQEIWNRVRTERLFADERRGRIEEPFADACSRKLGITTVETTPEDLQNYFPHDRPVYQTRVFRDPKAPRTAEVEARDIPFIGGPSGTVCYVLSGVAKLGCLEGKELDAYLMATDASMVAGGFHSFYDPTEVLAQVSDRIDLSARNHAELCAQALTPELKALPEYKWLVAQYNSDLSVSGAR